MKNVPLVCCALSLALGIVAMLTWGLTPPAWLAGLIALLLMMAAMVYGYTAYIPTIAPWLWLRPIRGTVLVMLGIVSMYVPPQLIIAAYLVGVGVRLVWQSACELDEKDKLNATPQLQVGDMVALQQPVQTLLVPQQTAIAVRR